MDICEQQKQQSNESSSTRSTAKAKKQYEYVDVTNGTVGEPAVAVTSSQESITVFVHELVHVCLSVTSDNRYSMRMALLVIAVAMLYINLHLPPMLLVGLVMVIQIPEEEQITRWKTLMRERIDELKNARLPNRAR